MGVELSGEEVCQDLLHQCGLHVAAYRAMLDLPGELVRYLSRVPGAERYAVGTRTGQWLLPVSPLTGPQVSGRGGL